MLTRELEESEIDPIYYSPIFGIIEVCHCALAPPRACPSWTFIMSSQECGSAGERCTFVWFFPGCSTEYFCLHTICYSLLRTSHHIPPSPLILSCLAALLDPFPYSPIKYRSNVIAMTAPVPPSPTHLCRCPLSCPLNYYISCEDFNLGRNNRRLQELGAFARVVRAAATVYWLTIFYLLSSL